MTAVWFVGYIWHQYGLHFLSQFILILSCCPWIRYGKCHPSYTQIQMGGGELSYRDVPPKMHLLNIKDSPAVGLKGGRFTVVSSCTDKGTPQLNMFQTVRVKYTFQTCCGWVFDTENIDFRQTTWSTFFMALTKVIKQEKLFNYSKKWYGYNKWPCMRLRNKTKYLIKLIKCWRTLCGHLILKINYK